MAEVTKTKRQGGQVKDGKWLVLTESTGKEGVGYTHSCGAEIQGKRVTHPVWDGPFPLSGSGARSDPKPFLFVRNAKKSQVPTGCR